MTGRRSVGPSVPRSSILPAREMSDDNGNVLSTIEPGSVKRIHLVGVAGTGMGSFAGMLKAAGYDVTGSDEKRLSADERHARARGASR